MTLKKPNPKDYYSEADYNRAVKRYNRTVKNTKGVQNAGSSLIKSVKDAWASRNNPRKPMVRKRSLTDKPKGEKGAWMKKGGKTTNPAAKSGSDYLGPGGKPTPKSTTPKSTPTKPKTTSKPSTTVTSKSAPKPIPKKKPQSKDMDANYKAWAKANPALAKKLLEKGDKKQAGYKALTKDKYKKDSSSPLSTAYGGKTWLEKNWKH